MNSSNAWKRFLKRKVSVVAGIVAILIVIIALVGPMFCTQDPYKQNLLNINKGPSAEHILGTDYLGRDTFTRIIYGARVSLGVAFAGVLLGSSVWASCWVYVQASSGAGLTVRSMLWSQCCRLSLVCCWLF